MIEEKIVKNTIRYCTSVDDLATEKIASAIVRFCREYEKIKEEFKLDSDVDKTVTSIIYDLIHYRELRLWLLIGDRND